jgi:hypothetical protein
MRVPIGPVVNAKDGDVIVFKTRIPAKADVSKTVCELIVYVGWEGFDFSPHTLEPFNYGTERPVMVKPLSCRLSKHTTKYEFALKATEDCCFRIYQNADNLALGETQTFAEVKAKHYGKTAIRVHRFLDNALRFVRRRNNPHVSQIS